MSDVHDIYLLIGQSNMAGRAPIEDQDRAALDGVSLFDGDDSWTPAGNEPLGLNRYSTVEEPTEAMTRLGPGYSFGRRLVQETGRSIGLVVNAKGGSGISQWRKHAPAGDLELYAGAVARARSALAATPGAQLRGILWHQGENDNVDDAEDYYLAELKELVAGLRTDLNAPDAVFVAGEVGRWQERGLRINPLIRAVPTVVDHAAWVSSDGLTTHETDRTPWGPHFDSASQRLLGDRYAEAALALG